MMEAMDTILENEPVVMAAHLRRPLGARLVAVLIRIRWALTLNRSRIALSELTDEQLADIGVSRIEAERECAKIGLF